MNFLRGGVVFFWFFSKHSLRLWLGLIFIFLLFSSRNIGGEGLDLPFNVMVWTLACLFIVSTLIKGILNKKIRWHALIFVLFVLLLGLLGVGAIHADWGKDALKQTSFNLVVITLFLWALFQYKMTQVQFIQLLMFFCLLGAVQSFIGAVQIHDTYRIFYVLTQYEAFRLTGDTPLGTFQQVNMLASFLAFTLVSGLYVVSTPLFFHSNRLLKIGLFLCLLLCAYVLFLTGSRAGLLSFLVGSSVMLMARHKTLWRYRMFFLLCLLMFSFGFFLSVTFPGNALGLGQVVQKTAGMSEGIRWVLYQQSLVLFMQSPLTGIGVGHFTESFAAHIKEHDLAALKIAYWTHPHNELLYWMLQSGIIALVLALVFIGYFLVVLFQSRRAFSLAIFALMIPFAIQSQLSYPFSLSSVHLFIPLVLMYVGTRRYVTTSHFSMPAWGQAGSIMVLCGFVVIILFSTWHSLKSIKELYIFDNSLFYTQFQSKEEIANQRYLQHATHNLLYREKAITAMNAMVKKAIESNNKYDLNQFVWWAQERGGEISEQSLLSLAKVYLAQEKIELAKQVVKKIKNQYAISFKLDALQREVDALKKSKKEALGEMQN